MFSSCIHRSLLDPCSPKTLCVGRLHEVPRLTYLPTLTNSSSGCASWETLNVKVLAHLILEHDLTKKDAGYLRRSIVPGSDLCANVVLLTVMENSTLDDIFKECPRFRILTSGKAGVGKTTLIKETFKINSLKASDKDPGKCNIEDEISYPQNNLFVLHDSQGFEAGEVDNFNKVKTFIERRAAEPNVKDRLHAIWLCLQIPRVGGRLMEAGDEDFLRLPFGDLPVVIVFTQFDRLCEQIEFSHATKDETVDLEKRKHEIQKEAEERYQRNCVDQLKKIKDGPKRLRWLWVSNKEEYRRSLEELVGITLELVRNHVQESVWIVSAAAQRINADANVASCIEVGMRKYWRGLAAGTYFANRRLDACIGVIHVDILNIWNFRDDDNILQKESFKEAVFILIQDLADANGRGPVSSIMTGLVNIKTVLDVATPLAGPLSPIVASAGLSVMFVKWLSEMYSSTPGVLRCLMGYIVDVTIVLEILFWFKVSQPKLPSLSQEDVDAAFGLYQGSSSHIEVHREIRNYVDNMKLLDHVNPDDRTHIEVERLINSQRRVLIDTIFSDAKKGTVPTPHTEVLSPPPNNLEPHEAGSSTTMDSSPSQSQHNHPTSRSLAASTESTPAPKKKSRMSRFVNFFR